MPFVPLDARGDTDAAVKPLAYFGKQISREHRVLSIASKEAFDRVSWLLKEINQRNGDPILGIWIGIIPIVLEECGW